MPLSLDALSDSDLKRFALCWLSCDRGTVNWEAAAAAYDPDVKWESFRTVTSKATNKVLKTANGDGEAPTPKPKKAAGGKRKKAADEEGGDDEAPKPKKKAGRPKKAKSEEKVASEEEAADKVKDDAESSD